MHITVFAQLTTVSNKMKQKTKITHCRNSGKIRLKVVEIGNVDTFSSNTWPLTFLGHHINFNYKWRCYISFMSTNLHFPWSCNCIPHVSKIQILLNSMYRWIINSPVCSSINSIGLTTIISLKGIVSIIWRIASI